MTVSYPANIRDASDQQLVTLAREGREDAKTEIVDRYRQPVQTAISHLVRNEEDVQDLTQDTFVKVFEELATVREESKLSAWVFKIANNVALDHLRREGLIQSKRVDSVPLDGASYPSAPRRVTTGGIPLAAPSQRTPTPPDASALAPAIEEAIGRLREQYRRCYTLHEVEGRSYGYIADLLDLPEGTVAWYIHCARKELRNQLGTLYDAWRARTPRPPG